MKKRERRDRNDPTAPVPVCGTCERDNCGSPENQRDFRFVRHFHPPTFSPHFLPLRSHCPFLDTSAPLLSVFFTWVLDHSNFLGEISFWYLQFEFLLDLRDVVLSIADRNFLRMRHEICS